MVLAVKFTILLAMFLYSYGAQADDTASLSTPSNTPLTTPLICFKDGQTAYEYLNQQTITQALNPTINQSENPRTKHSNPSPSAHDAGNKIITTKSQHKVININRASEAELTQLKGIGSKRAQDIILYREMMGGFVSVDELTTIKGIGKKTVEKNRHILSVTDIR